MPGTQPPLANQPKAGAQPAGQTLEQAVAQLQKDVAGLKKEYADATTAGEKANTDLVARVTKLEGLVGTPEK